MQARFGPQTTQHDNSSTGPGAARAGNAERPQSSWIGCCMWYGPKLAALRLSHTQHSLWPHGTYSSAHLLHFRSCMYPKVGACSGMSTRATQGELLVHQAEVFLGGGKIRVTAPGPALCRVLQGQAQWPRPLLVPLSAAAVYRCPVPLASCPGTCYPPPCSMVMIVCHLGHVGQCYGTGFAPGSSPP